MSHGKGRRNAVALDFDPQVLEAAKRNLERACQEEEELGLNAFILALQKLPEPFYLGGRLIVAIIFCVLLHFINVNEFHSAQKESELLRVKLFDKLERYQVIEAAD